MSEIQQFVKERNEALLKGDEAVKSFCKKWKIPFSSNSAIRERARLKAITAVPGLPLSERQKAKQRLDAVGSQSWDDGDLADANREMGLPEDGDYGDK